MQQKPFATTSRQRSMMSPELKPVRIATIKSNKFPLVSSTYASDWNINVPNYFQSNETLVENFDLTQSAASSPSQIQVEEQHVDEFTLLSWIVTLFMLSVVSAVVGFGELAGSLSVIAKLLALIFGVVCIGLAAYCALDGQYDA